MWEMAVKPWAQPALGSNPAPATEQNPRSDAFCAVGRRRVLERCITPSAGPVSSSFLLVSAVSGGRGLRMPVPRPVVEWRQRRDRPGGLLHEYSRVA